MPAAKPPTRKPAPKAPAAAEPAEVTDPGGPAPGVLAKARRDLPVQPGPGDATLVYDKNKGRAKGEQPRLLVTAGPRKGTEHLLADELTTIGRGEGNVLVIPDISVSRQHSRVEKQGDNWMVLDQGSGNGTRVNGKPVERWTLRHGDEIEMGDTKLKFVEPGGVMVKNASQPVLKPAAAAPANAGPQQSAFRKRAPIYGALAVGLCIVLAAGLVRRQHDLKLEEEAAAQADESRAFAQKRFQEGVALLKSGKWVEARDKLKIASELDPQDAEIARFLKSAQAEAPRAQQLAAAKTAMQRRDYAGARAALAGLPDDSALAEIAHELADQIRIALDGAVREAKSRVEAGDAAGAQELLDPVLAAEPSRPDALAVKEAIAGQKRVAAAAPSRNRAAQKPAGSAAPAPDVQGILDAYLSGDIGAAIERAQSAQSPRGEKLLGDLKAFDAAFKDGIARKEAGRNLDAIRALETAAAADRTIAQGRDGRLGREVRKALSALHTQAGTALAAADESLPEAARHLRAAVQDDPQNEAAQAQLRQLADRCKDIYLRAYVAKDEDVEAARKAFKLVIETLPPTDETAQKSKRWLDKLNGKISESD